MRMLRASAAPPLPIQQELLRRLRRIPRSCRFCPSQCSCFKGSPVSGAESPNRSPAGYPVSRTRPPVCGARSMTMAPGEILGPEHLSLSWHHCVLLEVPQRTAWGPGATAHLSALVGGTLRSDLLGVRHVTRSACECFGHRCIGWPALVGVAGNARNQKTASRVMF